MENGSDRAMRPELIDPTADDPRLEAAIAVGRELYARFEAGEDCTAGLQQLGSIAGMTISKFDLEGAFGSVDAKAFSRQLLVDWSRMPRGLSEPEMLELIERIVSAKADDVQTVYWLRCLEANTGDSNISDLIFWPGEYFGDGDNGRELSAEQILETALRSPKPIVLLGPSTA